MVYSFIEEIFILSTYSGRKKRERERGTSEGRKEGRKEGRTEGKEER